MPGCCTPASQIVADAGAVDCGVPGVPGGMTRGVAGDGTSEGGGARVLLDWPLIAQVGDGV